MILPEGTKVRMKEAYFLTGDLVWSKGDIATLPREVNTEQFSIILIDLNNQDNSFVRGDGRWFALAEDFEVIDA